ncbi:MAG: hypothetical protein MUE90_14505, partial [Thermoanaerobaculales bacterium]|nr:hypothetical protein [Thermoanaerobaculales bacterium]
LSEGRSFDLAPVSVLKPCGTKTREVLLAPLVSWWFTGWVGGNPKSEIRNPKSKMTQTGWVALKTQNSELKPGYNASRQEDAPWI